VLWISNWCWHNLYVVCNVDESSQAKGTPITEERERERESTPPLAHIIFLPGYIYYFRFFLTGYTGSIDSDQDIVDCWHFAFWLWSWLYIWLNTESLQILITNNVNWFVHYSFVITFTVTALSCCGGEHSSCPVAVKSRYRHQRSGRGRLYTQINIGLKMQLSHEDRVATVTHRYMLLPWLRNRIYRYSAWIRARVPLNWTRAVETSLQPISAFETRTLLTTYFFIFTASWDLHLFLYLFVLNAVNTITSK